MREEAQQKRAAVEPSLPSHIGGSGGPLLLGGGGGAGGSGRAGRGGFSPTSSSSSSSPGPLSLSPLTSLAPPAVGTPFADSLPFTLPGIAPLVTDFVAAKKIVMIEADTYNEMGTEWIPASVNCLKVNKSSAIDGWVAQR